jgi:hypothetical protein
MQILLIEEISLARIFGKISGWLNSFPKRCGKLISALTEEV